MTREEAKEYLPIMQAFAEGKQIQYLDDHGFWNDIKTCVSFDYNISCYRINPEIKYRPFKSQEECWNEMHKHPDFGWVVAKNSKIMYHIYVVGIRYLLIDGMSSISFSETFADYEFTDGKPFGIKEE